MIHWTARSQRAEGGKAEGEADSDTIALSKRPEAEINLRSPRPLGTRAPALIYYYIILFDIAPPHREGVGGGRNCF